MPIKPNPAGSQIDNDGDDQSVARAGGAASKNSTPSVLQGTPGARYAAVAQALSRSKRPSAMGLAPGAANSRQFNTKASGGDSKKAVKSPRTYSGKQTADARQQDATPAEGKRKAGSLGLFRQGKELGK